jgi:hypothetical protein
VALSLSKPDDPLEHANQPPRKSGVGWKHQMEREKADAKHLPHVTERCKTGVAMCPTIAGPANTTEWCRRVRENHHTHVYANTARVRFRNNFVR